MEPACFHYVHFACMGLVRVDFDETVIRSIVLLGERAAPAATAWRDPPHVVDLVARLERYASGLNPAFHEVSLPLEDLTPFAAHALIALRGTAPGDVLAYGELAALAGHPGASRAVGHALSKNRWPIVVPCHRVTRADGSLGGFTGGDGSATKKALLDHERTAFLDGSSPRS